MVNKKILSFYKRILPQRISNKISILRNAGGLNTIRKQIISDYVASPEKITNEIHDVLKYLENHPLSIFPYPFHFKYKSSDVVVYFDPIRTLYFVYHEGKKMYFKRSLNASQVQECYNTLLMEQDLESPHRYLTEKFNVQRGQIVADIGTAEGIFGLSVVEKAGKLFLFETDLEWIEALEATFFPWKNKVVIVNKYVTDSNTSNQITLDQFSLNQNISFDLMKIDVDGAELSLLKGSHSILSSIAKPKIAICTYHKGTDEQLFRNIFQRYEMPVENSKGYMVFIYERPITTPYLRRGLLRTI